MRVVEEIPARPDYPKGTLVQAAECRYIPKAFNIIKDGARDVLTSVPAEILEVIKV